MQKRNALVIALIISIACLATGCSSKGSNSNNSNNANRTAITTPENANLASIVESTANAALQNPRLRNSNASTDTQTGEHSTKSARNTNRATALNSSKPNRNTNNDVRRIANEGERQIRNILGRP